MTTEMWIIAAVRVAGSLPVLRWPFPGALLAILIDLSDLFMMNLIHLGGVRDYQEFDKYLDQVYMLAFLIVALGWDPVTRLVAAGLYLFRLAGFALFEVYDDRDILLLFPNFFEVWFVFIAGVRFFRLDFRGHTLLLSIVAALLLAVKVFQEYAIHYERWLDDITAVEALQDIWEFLTSPFG